MGNKRISQDRHESKGGRKRSLQGNQHIAEADTNFAKNKKMADTEIKKKGRPKKRDTEVAEVSPKKSDASNGDSAPPPAKRGRGRPPKGAKATAAAAAAAIAKGKVPGRGRGRPPKNSVAVSKKKQKEPSESEDNDDDKKESSEEPDSS